MNKNLRYSLLLAASLGLSYGSSDFENEPAQYWEEAYQPGVFEGLFFENDDITRIEKGYQRTVQYGIVLSREYVFGTSFNVFFKEKKRELVIEFADMKLGESKLETEFSFPIVELEFDEYIVDQNQLLSGAESEFKYVTSLKFVFDEDVEYNVEVNEHNELKISISHILPLEEFAASKKNEPSSLSRFKNWIKESVKMAEIKSLN